MPGPEAPRRPWTSRRVALTSGIAWMVFMVALALVVRTTKPSAPAPPERNAPADDRPAVACAEPGFAPVAGADAGTRNSTIGINLAGPADGGTELPFVDAFKLSRAWISQKQDAAWGTGPPLDLDERGWVKRLEPNCWAETALLTFDGHKPPGTYTVLYDGDGDVSLGRGPRELLREPGRILYAVDRDAGGLFLQVRRTNPADHVRAIRVILPGFVASYRAQPFRPGFLAMWRGVNTFRFMDWMATNGSTVAAWNDRPRADDATFTVKGVPLEVMVDLCNRTLANPWFCMPHRATDEYVKRFAEMVRDTLDPTLHVYVEYSNELWNGMFAQSKYACERGRELGLAEKPWEAGWRYTAARSVEIFAIWETVFGGRDRLVRVLATQSANTYVSQRILEFQDAYTRADALAVAPYLAMNIPAEAGANSLFSAADVAQWDVQRVLGYVAEVSFAAATRDIAAQRKVAAACGLRLVAYEGGQHLVGVNGGENNADMNQLFFAANRHERMGEIHATYYDAWRAGGGDLFCAFSSVGRWGTWGSWGLAEYHDSTAADAPKLAATLAWMQAFPLDNRPPAIGPLADLAAVVGRPFALNGLVANDVASRMALAASWSSSAPEAVRFEDARSPRTRAVCTVPGTYRLALRVADGFARASATLTVTAR